MKPHHALQGLCAIAALALFGCATAPPPLADTLRAADDAVASADDARASDYDSIDMHAAREKLAAARVLAQQTQDPKDPNAIKARWLAEEASADAGLAEAKAMDVRAEGVLRQLQNPAGAADAQETRGAADAPPAAPPAADAPAAAEAPPDAPGPPASPESSATPDALPPITPPPLPAGTSR
jgi:hypothetical protein